MTTQLLQIFSFVRQTPKILNILAFQISYRNFFNIQFLKIMNKVSRCCQIFKITILNVILSHLFYDGMDLSAVVIRGTWAIVLFKGFKMLLRAEIHGPLHEVKSAGRPVRIGPRFSRFLGPGWSRLDQDWTGPFLSADPRLRDWPRQEKYWNLPCHSSQNAKIRNSHWTL